MTTTISPFEDDLISQKFIEYSGKSIEDLLQPISTEHPSGESLKSNGVYSAIKQARRADDPNLPMGEWQHDLKIADWDKVEEIALSALSDKTKDLQIAIWLLEAQINKHGFAGIAPAMTLISALSEKFWQNIHPQIVDGDIEYRTNLVAWVNEKLQPSLRQIPITDTRNDTQYSWANWELALQIEQQYRGDVSELTDFIPSQTIVQSIAATHIEFYQTLYQDISAGVMAIEHYSTLLETYCAEKAPTLMGLRTLLLEIRDTIASHVKHRGLFAVTSEENVPTNNESNIVSSPNSSDNHNNQPPGEIKNREQAYQQLANAADYLMQDDPHSPVPYMVYKAIDWGTLNTAELYQELFVKYQGQLNIFEILGLDIEQK